MPLIEVARAETKDEGMAALERWKARHVSVWPRLEPADVVVDAMRGRNSLSRRRAQASRVGRQPHRADRMVGREP